MRAHAITTKASTAVSGAILALGLAVVLLAATPSTASAEQTLSSWYCPPPEPRPTDIGQVPLECLGGPLWGDSSFDFGDRQVGTTSPVQRFALGVWCAYEGGVCPDTLNPSITVPGDFYQTNNCEPTLSAGYPRQLQGCMIEVTFAPTSTGPAEGALSLGAGGPTVALTGNGVTTPTPPALPLLLSLKHPRSPFAEPKALPRKKLLRKKAMLYATTNHDSTIVARGGVKRTVARTTTGEALKGTTFKAKLKHLGRLTESPREPTVRIKVAATDEFGQRATKEFEITLCRREAVLGKPHCGRRPNGRGGTHRRR
jgi:hypothetical protein